MADYRVKVSSDELRQAVARFNTCKAEIMQAYAAMATDAMTLNTSWDGEASQAFFDRCSQLIANIRTSDATIEQAVEGLEKAAGIYEAVENENLNLGEGMTQAPEFSG